MFNNFLDSYLNWVDDRTNGVAEDAPYYKTKSHIKWRESKGVNGCPEAVSHDCSHFKRGCKISGCKHAPAKYKDGHNE